MSVNTKMTAIADELRTLSGQTEALTLDAMASAGAAANADVSVQADLIAQIQTALEGKTSVSLVLQEKTVSPTTSAQSITPDSGYDGLSKVTVNAMTTATQATPSISVSSAGLITASATQTAGYVTAGTKSATKQLTVQAAQTITPGTSNKTIASGRYLTGTQTIKGDANLKAENIASGVSIFGITGTHSGGEGSSGGSVETCTVILNEPRAGTIGSYIATCYNANKFSAVCYASATDALPSYPITIENVVCGSAFFVSGAGVAIPGWKYDYNLFTMHPATSGLMGTITAAADDILTITLYNND